MDIDLEVSETAQKSREFPVTKPAKDVDAAKRDLALIIFCKFTTF